MVRWHHRLDGHEFEQALGVGDGQRSLECCSPWERRVGHDWAAEQQTMRTLQRTWEKMLEGLSALWTLQSLRPTCPWTWILSYCSPHCSSSRWSLPHQRLTSCGQNGWRARSDWVPAGVHLACSTTPGEIWKRPGGVVHNAAQRPLWSPVAQQAQHWETREAGCAAAPSSTDSIPQPASQVMPRW